MHAWHGDARPGSNEGHGRGFGQANALVCLDHDAAGQGDTGTIPLVEPRSDFESQEREMAPCGGVVDW